MAWVEVLVLDVVQETPLDRSFILEVPAAQRSVFEFVPGQYLIVRDPGETPERDWYFSLSAAPNPAGTLRITVRGRGDAVRRIYDARPGARWHARAPAGSFRVQAAPGERVVLAAAGSGVTPFRAFVEQHDLAKRRDPVWLLHCARAADELLFHDELSAWALAREAFTYVPSVTGTDMSWEGQRGRLDETLLRRALGEPAGGSIYACGPGAFVDDVLRMAKDLGVPPTRRLREAW